MTWYDDMVNAPEYRPTYAAWVNFFNHVRDLTIEDLAVLDSTTNDVTTSAHGLVPKASGVVTQYLRGDGIWSAPPGTGGVGGATGATDNAILLADGVSTDTIKGSGITIETTITNSDTKVPTSAAVTTGLAAKAASSHEHAGSAITSGTVAAAYLPEFDGDNAGIVPVGTNSGTKYLRDDATWQVVTAGASRWTAIAAFTRTPPSTSTITLTGDQSATVKVGMPIRWAHTTAFYGIITAVAVSGDTTVTLAGAPLTASADYIDADTLYLGNPEGVHQEVFAIPGYFDDGAGATTLLKSDLLMEYVWGKSHAYLVQVSAMPDVAETGATKPVFNVLVNAAAALSTGLTLTTADAWVDSVVAVDAAQYDINRGEKVELELTTEGTNKTARNLSVRLLFVLE